MLKKEIFGLVKHVGINYDAVMKMPIQERRFYIYEHNRLQEDIKEKLEKTK